MGITRFPGSGCLRETWKLPNLIYFHLFLYGLGNSCSGKSKMNSAVRLPIREQDFLRCCYSLWPGRFWWKFRWVLFKPITMIDGWDIFSEIALRRMSLDLTDDKSTLVHVMAWWCQATSHYLSQCWPSSLSPYDVTRPQWVKAWNRCKKKKKNLWNLNQNMPIFMQDNLLRNVVSKIVAILFLPQCISWSQRLLLCGYWERLNGNIMSYKPQSLKFKTIGPWEIRLEFHKHNLKHTLLINSLTSGRFEWRFS